MIRGFPLRKRSRGNFPCSLFFYILKLKTTLLIFFFGVINLHGQNIAEKLIQIDEIFSLAGKEDYNYYFYFPTDIESDSKGNIYIIDAYNNRIQIFDKKGNFIKTIGRYGTGPMDLNKPEDIYVDEKQNKIYIADTRNRRIQICSGEGTLINIIKLDFLPQRILFLHPYLYVSSFPFAPMGKEKGLIKRINTNGKIEKEFLTPIQIKELSIYLLYNIILMKKDKRENLIIARKWGLNQVMIFDTNCRLQKEFKIIYKASKWVKPGIIDFPLKNDEDIDKIPFIIADITFDSNNNYYFLAGNIEKKLDGSIERRREIYKYSSKGVYLGTIILPVPAKLIHIDNQNNLYIIDDNFILRKYRFLE